MSAINSRLVMAAISPFGQTGPYRDFKGGELIAWHVGGLGYETPAHAVTDPDSQPPLKLAGQQAMHLSGWAAAAGVMLALADRDSTGQGQLVDVSSMEAVANIIRGSLILHPYDVSRVGRTRQKSGFSASPMFQCKDGYVSISLSQERWWKTLIEAPGAPPELKGPDYADAGGRRLNATALEALITSWFMEYTREELYDIFIPLHLPCFPVNSMREVTGSRQYAAREYFATQDHPVAGAVTHPGPVTRMAGVERQPRLPAPTLGGNDAVRFQWRPTVSSRRIFPAKCGQRRFARQAPVGRRSGPGFRVVLCRASHRRMARRYGRRGDTRGVGRAHRVQPGGGERQGRRVTGHQPVFHMERS